MVYQKYYFESDNYGVTLYEEEVTTEPQQRTTSANPAAEVVRGVGHWNPISDHNYNRKIPKGVARGRRGFGSRQQLKHAPPFLTTSCQKRTKFTGGQLRELRRAFEETHYPDALQRKELARRIKREEDAVKVWFNSQRAILRKSQTALMNNVIPPSSQNQFSLKIVKENRNVIVLQQPVSNGLLSCQPHVGYLNWH